MCGHGVLCGQPIYHHQWGYRYTPVQNNRDKGSHSGDTDTPVQNNRDKGFHNTDADQGSAVRGTPQKDRDFSIGDLFRNRKKHSSTDEDEPSLKMSREILHQVDKNLGIQEAEGSSC